jgi:uncharacterized protein YkwD
MSTPAFLSRSRKLGSAALVLSLAAAGALAIAPTASAGTSTERSISIAVLNQMNSERAANRLPALRMSTAMINSGRQHNLAMARANTLSHQLPGEAVFSTRISQAGVRWHAAAENVAWTTNRTTAGAQALQSAMYNEKAPDNGHRLNILSSSLHYVGIDVYLDNGTGKLWMTEDFADVTTVAVATSTAAHNPVGVIDSLAVMSGHRVRMSGWAVDPDSKATSLYVAVYYDGRYAGRFLGNAVRPDVAAAKHAGKRQGYSIVLTLPAGAHAISTYAFNIRIGNANTKLGTRTARV